MLTPGNNEPRNTSNESAQNLAVDITKKIDPIKALSSELGKNIEDLFNADHNPHLVNLTFELTENRRRQTELAQTILEKAVILEMDIERILFQYQTQLNIQWTEELEAVIENDLNIKNIQKLFETIILLEKKQFLELISILQQKISALQLKISVLQQEISTLKEEIKQGYVQLKTMVSDIFQKMIDHAPETITIHGISEPIQLRLLLNDVKEELANKAAHGELTAENADIARDEALAHSIFNRYGDLSSLKREEVKKTIKQDIFSLYDTSFDEYNKLAVAQTQRIALLNDKEQLKQALRGTITDLQSALASHAHQNTPLIQPSAPPQEGNNQAPSRNLIAWNPEEKEENHNNHEAKYDPASPKSHEANAAENELRSLEDMDLNNPSSLSQSSPKL